jgi:GTP-binding protein EngB required for normal cell division/Flp pilus assembly protein TadD
MALLENILATLTGGETVPEVVRKEIAQALACADDGELVIAEARLLGLADDHPEMAAVFLALGEVRVRRGHDEDAVEAYGRAVNLAKNAAEGWLGLGEALVRLRRPEPARDALRRVLSGTTDAVLLGRAHAARARLALAAGRASEAVRELRKATEACPRDREMAAELGRALMAAGDQEGWRWLVHAAQDLMEKESIATRAAADLLVEAASACPEPTAAHNLLRAGLAELAWSGELRARLQAALAEHLAAAGQTDEARTLAAQALSGNPEDAFVLAAWRSLAEASGDLAGALAAAKREAELGAPAPATTIVRLALAAQSRAELHNVQERLAEESPGLAAALTAWLNGSSRESEALSLAPLARSEGARRFVAQALAPAAPPAGNLAGLLAFACDLATRSPELQPLLPAAMRAAEALQRPLRVAVMGEFNAGKSSFVNALCGAEIARVGVTPTTATINLLRFGEPGGRVHFHDGRVEDRDAGQIRSFVAGLDEAAAGAVRMVEIFHPLPVLQKTEVVDTPGTNSLRPEHERVARDFLAEADAIVWVFSLAQAGKESERGMLDLAHSAGKQVLGVLNKADQASPDEVAQVLAHVSRSLADRVATLLPLSARNALSAQLAGDQDRWRSTGMPEVHAALQERFFQHAESLKQHTARAALARFVDEAETLARPASPEDLARRRAELDACEARVNVALTRERLNLPANLDDGFRRAAVETLGQARPRVWPLEEPRALAGDQEYLLDLLEEAIASATEATKAALLAEAGEALDLPIAPMVDQFAAYARGMLAGSLAEDFLRQYLSKPGRVDVQGAAAALTRRLPDAEAELFSPLAARLRAVFAQTRAGLALHADRQAMAAALLEARLTRPLAELRACLGRDQ